MDKRGIRYNAGCPVFWAEWNCTMNGTERDIYFMRLALEEAGAAYEEGEVPVGALLVIDGEIICTARNCREANFDPTGHAEILAMRQAAQKIGNWRLSEATLYVTKEPCPMCAGAMINARLGKLVYGCGDVKGGAVANLYQLLSDSRLNHQVEIVSGVLEEESAQLLKRFFGERRNKE
jgi:tRNA(adenine34) deaminase